LVKARHLPYNPASELELPKVGRRLPAAVLTATEAEAILAQPNVSGPLGLRDRTLMEVLYR
jgi:integrase/recombinase XerD